MENNVDLVLCTDCTQAAVNDDYTGLDYHYSEPESTARMEAIQAGLRRLGPGLSLNDGEFEDEELSREKCDCCGTMLAGRRVHFTIIQQEPNGPDQKEN